MATLQNEAEDLDVNVHSHMKAKSAIKVPKGETRPIRKLKSEVTKLPSTLKASDVTSGTRAKMASGNPEVHSRPPQPPLL